MRHIYNDDFDGSSAAADDLFCPSPPGSPSAAQAALLTSSSKLVLASLPPRYPLEFLPANMCVTPAVTLFLRSCVALPFSSAALVDVVDGVNVIDVVDVVGVVVMYVTECFRQKLSFLLFCKAVAAHLLRAQLSW